MSDEAAAGRRLCIDGLRFGYPGRPDFLGPVSMVAEPGRFWTIAGPNGAGKSTLIKLIAGLLKPTGGNIRVESDSPPVDLHDLPGAERARLIAYLPQQVPAELNFTVREIVLMGRYPHRSLSLFESAADLDAAQDAMAATQITHLADRPLRTLSGGETRRVHLASAFAQNPRWLLLDEPTTSLDVKHQIAIYRMLEQQTTTKNTTAIVVTHDINLATRFGTDALLLSDGKPVACGPPAEVFSPENLSAVYQVAMKPAGQDWLVPDISL